MKHFYFYKYKIFSFKEKVVIDLNNIQFSKKHRDCYIFKKSVFKEILIGYCCKKIFSFQGNIIID